MTAATLTERAWRTMLTGAGHAELAAAQREYRRVPPTSDTTVECPHCHAWNWGTEPSAIEHAPECGR